MEKKRITEEMRELLKKPFPPEALGTIDSKPYLTSIKAQYIIERLNDVFGIGRWTLEHEEVKEQYDQILIKGRLTFADYDIIVPEQYGSHKITGKGVELADGYKSAITDCITKSASYLEIGTDVFKGLVKPPVPEIEVWLTDEQFKKALNSDIQGITATLRNFNNLNGKGMSKDKRKALQDKLKKLKQNG